MSLLSYLSRRLRGSVDDRDETTAPPSAGPDGTPPSSPEVRSTKYLVAVAGSTLPQQRHHFVNQIEIGRDEPGREATRGQLLLPGSNVSWRHCIITQSPEGRCFVRDVSRNGTRLGGRRLVPNVETEIRVGQTLDLGPGLQFVLGSEPATGPATTSLPRIRTAATPNLTLATVLVGDIRDYTVLVREAPATDLQQSVSRVFERLAASVVELGGTVKEFPGDAILAFWEGGPRGDQAISACRAAIELDRLARRIAVDPSIWALKDYPLRMDWALATGQVVIDSFGGDTPIGLSMVGEPVVLACRLEKFATDETGRILTCHMTRKMVATASPWSADAPLRFADLGLMHAKGFDRPDQVFALQVPEP